MAEFLRKYNTAATVNVPMIKAGVRDFAVSADWTPANPDVRVSKDEGALANITTLPVPVNTGAPSWKFSLSAAEMSCARLTVMIVDTAPKGVEDNQFDVVTFGNAAAQYATDFSNLPTLGTGAGQINVDGLGNVFIGDRFKRAQSLLKFPFIMTDSTTHAPKIGLGSNFIVTRNIDNTGFAAGTINIPAGGAAEIGNGWYTFDFGSNDLNGNCIAVRVTAVGADDLDFTILTQP
jgi:hypothetical protein